MSVSFKMAINADVSVCTGFQIQSLQSQYLLVCELNVVQLRAHRLGILLIS